MKRTEQILIYDKSFNGFLSAVYAAFQHGLEVADFSNRKETQVGLFADNMEIKTNIEHAKRVWEGLQKKNYSALKNIYFAFLSETVGIEKVLYQYIRSIVLNKTNSDLYDLNKHIARVDQLAALVSREKQRIENSVRFHSTMDELRIAYVEPSFNVLPLVSKHVRSRYPRYSWVIFDRRRQYGLFYNGSSLEMISASFLHRIQNLRTQTFESRKLRNKNLEDEIQHSGFINKETSSEIDAYSAA